MCLYVLCSGLVSYLVKWYGGAVSPLRQYYTGFFWSSDGVFCFFVTDAKCHGLPLGNFQSGHNLLLRKPLFISMTVDIETSDMD